MLLNIYVITVLASFGIGTASTIATLIKMKQMGYKFSGKTKEKLDQLSIGGKIAILGLSGIVILIASVGVYAIPILNVILSVKDILNWNESIYKTIEKWETKGIITMNSIFPDKFNKTNNSKSSKITSLLQRENDSKTREIIESMFVEGANEKDIKCELKTSKDTRKEILNEALQKKANNFASNMVDEIMLNVNLSTKQRQKLLNEYKKVALSEKSKTLKPIYETLNLVSTETGPVLNKK